MRAQSSSSAQVACARKLASSRECLSERVQRGSIASQRTAAQAAHSATSSAASAAAASAPLESLPEECRLALAIVALRVPAGAPGVAGVFTDGVAPRGGGVDVRVGGAVPPAVAEVGAAVVAGVAEVPCTRAEAGMGKAGVELVWTELVCMELVGVVELARPTACPEAAPGQLAASDASDAAAHAHAYARRLSR